MFRTTFAASALAFSLVLTGCGSTTIEQPRNTPQCSQYEVLEYDEDGAECEPDENQNGVNDENEGQSSEEEQVREEDDSDKKKSTKRKRR